MPPMARTSRNGAPNVDALDNLNLDDMFADGGDDLFDGLDMDLGNLDDIAGSNNANMAAADAVKEDEKAPATEAPEPAATGREGHQ